MIIGNRTDHPFALRLLDKFYNIPSLGTVTVEDTAGMREAWEKLMATETYKALLEGGYLVVDREINPYQQPLEVSTPEPPEYLTRKPAKYPVKRGKPTLTGERVEV